MSQNAKYICFSLLRGLKINLSSETKKAILLNLRYHRDKKYQPLGPQLCAVKLGRRSVRAGAKDSSGQFYLGNRAARDRTCLDDSG